MIITSDLIHLIFVVLFLGRSLVKASISDFKTRKVPINTWNFVVYIALPISMITIGLKMMDGRIDITNPLQHTYLFFTAIFILFIGILSWCSPNKNIGAGGADFIALMLIILTSISIDIYLPFAFIIVFILCSIATIIITLLLINKKGFVIPLIVTISIAYFISIGFYIFNGFSAFFVI